MKKILFVLIFLLYSTSIFADQLNVTIEINEVLPNQGKIIIAIFNSKDGYKKKIPYKTLTIDSTSTTLLVDEVLPNGEYVISMFQDKNGNGKLDTYIFGIPKEQIGITNYFKKGIPGGFNKLKIQINEDKMIIRINMIHFGVK
ncbi:MAG: hypothetical protein A2163_02995 [Actinobacteria bacterium RBG_13_35_12]|uniref:DUF2141 domain-containing protein n=1 Tax=Candidatus Sediminicultor quintus TaxID=1797291 RepID=A0A1F5A5C9_9BACT|nr:MAG: hypothetical protein A2163_02995 [Actinobacteria bacterium RBG_13_35_12]OGD13779.1 MAG: hypothetical protein A2V47_00620 [Candidatus Atribacteria bacterium RBG_19FT_COMBO_35_14]